MKKHFEYLKFSNFDFKIVENLSNYLIKSVFYANIKIFIISLLLTSLQLFAQESRYPNQYLFSSDSIVKFDGLVSSPVYPNHIIVSKIDSNSLCQKRSLLLRKLSCENLIFVDSIDYQLIINPMFDFALGKEKNYAHRLYENTRGFEVKGHLYHKLFFSSELYETQFSATSYNHIWIDSFGVAPGIMRVKEFKENAWDVASVYGSVTYVPNKNFHIALARDKLFIGDGYRSMFISHNSPAYNYLQSTWVNKYFHYDYFLTFLQNPKINNIVIAPQSSLAGYQPKYASISFLIFKLHEKVHLGLYESIIWNAHNSKYNSIHIKHFNPFIFLKTINYGFDNENNAAVGFSLRYSPMNNFQVYTQYLLDNIQFSNKNIETNSALQVGFKVNNMQNRIPFYTQIEINAVSPYTYGHNNPLQTYSHYNHSLAHPLGANLNELVFIAYTKVGRFIPLFMCSYGRAGIDSENNELGQSVFAAQKNNISQSNFFPKIQGKNSSLLFLDARLNYVFNSSSMYHIFVEAQYRKVNIKSNINSTMMFQFGFSTSIRHFYQDVSWL